jgi:hypothetical protein
MAYLLKEGLNQALVDLVAIDPQPRCEGLQYARVSQAASGAVVTEGPHVILIWDVIEDPSAYDDLLDQFGLDAATSASVTITLPNDLFAQTRYNGTAVRPVPGQTVQRTGYFIRDVQIIVKDLTVAS